MNSRQNNSFKSSKCNQESGFWFLFNLLIFVRISSLLHIVLFNDGISATVVKEERRYDISRSIKSRLPKALLVAVIG